MKTIWIATALFAVLPWSAGAQVEKQVEVTKAYIPSLESASKLSVRPDMTDTVHMRPDIDYTITPLSLQTTLQTRSIRPATVTYWEFNRPLPFYLKVGAGYPLNSVVDFYASSQNPGTGYVIGYLNHEGRYADIKNTFGKKNNSVRMTNRVGVAAGKYLGRRVLEGEVSYENRLYNRYGAYAFVKSEDDISPSTFMNNAQGSRVDFGDADLSLRFGDDFQDLSRTNFEVALRGNLFFDHSDWRHYDPVSEDYTRYVGGEASVGARAKVARGFGRHRLSVDVEYDYLAGRKTLSDQQQQQIKAGVRYGLDGGIVRMEVGADYWHDKVRGVKGRSYITPFARLDISLGTEAIRPFVELDGGVYNNSYRSLTRQNPYLDVPTWLDRSSVDYNGRLGLNGSLWRNRFNYRVYADFSVKDHHVYWSGVSYFVERPLSMRVMAHFTPTMARQTVTSFHGEIDYRPLSVLRFDLGIHGYLYNDETKLRNGAPALRANMGARYEGRKIAVGVKALFEGKRSWSVETVDMLTPENHFSGDSDRVRSWVDLQIDFEWKISGRVGIFAEGRNLLNTKILLLPYYPEYGANFTLGAKIRF